MSASSASGQQTTRSRHQSRKAAIPETSRSTAGRCGVRGWYNFSMLKQSTSAIRGEVLTDPASRARYSLAECIYRLTPHAAILPASREDVLEALKLAREEGLPLTARGAGSAVAGQSLGSGIILDFAAHMNRILEINALERWARVEPGVDPRPAL